MQSRLSPTLIISTTTIVLRTLFHLLLPPCTLRLSCYICRTRLHDGGLHVSVVVRMLAITQPDSFIWLKYLSFSIAQVVILNGHLAARSFLEIALYLGTLGGPILFLTLILLSNLFLTFWPFVDCLLGRSKSYEEAFRKARKYVAGSWVESAQNFFGHRISGFDKIPATGGAVLVYYHGAIPIDYMLLVCHVLLRKDRLIRSIVDRVLLWVPGFELIGHGCGAHVSNRAKCIQMLRQGHLIGIAPGGGYEAQLATSDYPVMWKKRTGFAHIALEAKVPIIPVFTENIRETFVTMKTGYWFWAMIYNLTKIPIMPVYGGFPTKLHCHIGHPIYPALGMTVEELRVQTINEMEMMINKHQKRPGSIFESIRQNLNSPRHQIILKPMNSIPFKHWPKIKPVSGSPSDPLLARMRDLKRQTFRDLKEFLDKEQTNEIERLTFGSFDGISSYFDLQQMLAQHNQQMLNVLNALSQLKDQSSGLGSVDSSNNTSSE